IIDKKVLFLLTKDNKKMMISVYRQQQSKIKPILERIKNIRMSLHSEYYDKVHSSYSAYMTI
ncbi:MAG: hypothetical protein Q6363_000645, partial [Candidatus Njordarchaeota archaeon]